MMPTSTDHFFLAHPVELDGAEQESASGPATVDGALTIPVDVIGSRVPVAGDILTAYHLGGRWVAESGAGAMVSCYALKCGNCLLPQEDLTLSWSNLILGSSSTTLAWNGSTWQSPCVNGLLYVLLCNAGSIELRVIYFVTGACPTGTQQYCSNLRAAPFGLNVTSFVCSPLALTFATSSASCPTITNSGYTRFTVTGPPLPYTPPGTYCCVTVTTAVCGCVVPGVITILVQKNDAGGEVVFSGRANTKGFVVVPIPAPGLYRFSASTTTPGYGNQPWTTVIGKSGTACNPASVATALVPATLTASGFWGDLTVRPGLGDPYYGPSGPGNSCASASGPNLYIGTVDAYPMPGACGCPAIEQDIDFAFIACGELGQTVPRLQWCVPAFAFIPHVGGVIYCPGTGPEQTQGGFAANLGGSGFGLNGCYPVALSASGLTGGIPGIAMGCCSEGLVPTCPFSVGVTQ